MLPSVWSEFHHFPVSLRPDAFSLGTPFQPPLHLGMFLILPLVRIQELESAVSCGWWVSEGLVSGILPPLDSEQKDGKAAHLER